MYMLASEGDEVNGLRPRDCCGLKPRHEYVCIRECNQ